MIDFLTSDFVGYVLMALLIIVLAFLAYFLLSSITHHIRVSRFFAQYRPSAGINKTKLCLGGHHNVRNYI